MSSQTQALLERMAGEPQTPIVRRLRALLASPAAEVIVAGSGPTSAAELERTYSVRQKVAQLRRKRFFGLPGVLAKLRASGERPVRVLGVIDERESGTIFFDAETDRFLGAIIVSMSPHTRAYYDGRLTGSPLEQTETLARTA